MSSSQGSLAGVTNLPLNLVAFLRDLLGIRYFVETGTGLGRTARIASRLFPWVRTIEVHKGRWREAMNALSDCRNVTCLWGDSTEVLPGVLEALQGRAMLFLDAHCVSRPKHEGTSCPLLAELRAVRKGDVVLIDDVKYFMVSAPPGVPQEEWPELVEVMDALRATEANSYLFIYGNCLVAVPRDAAVAVGNYVREHLDYSPFEAPK